MLCMKIQLDRYKYVQRHQNCIMTLQLPIISIACTTATTSTYYLYILPLLPLPTTSTYYPYYLCTTKTARKAIREAVRMLLTVVRGEVKVVGAVRVVGVPG